MYAPAASVMTDVQLHLIAIHVVILMIPGLAIIVGAFRMILLPLDFNIEQHLSTIWLPECGWCTQSICRKLPLLMFGYNDYVSRSYVNYIKETDWNIIF
jgi:hypothetical protein